MAPRRLEDTIRRYRLAPILAAALFAGHAAAEPEPGSRPVPEPSHAPLTGRITGRIELLDAGGATAAARDAVVWVPGVPAATGERPAMASRAKRFAPRVVAVASGATVVFPNDDRIYHNVFSTTEGQGFDLGLYRNGASRSHRFEATGLVAIFCNIHPQMAGYVRVVDGAHAQTGEDGAFEIAKLPAGSHVVRIWHERGGERSLEAVVSAGGSTDLTVVLDASRYRASGHLNKHGQNYPPAALDDDRY